MQSKKNATLARKIMFFYRNIGALFSKAKDLCIMYDESACISEDWKKDLEVNK